MVGAGFKMTAAPDNHFRPLPYLVSLGAVGAATATVFFGVAFLWLTPPPPADPPADPDPPAQALEAPDAPAPPNNHTVWDSSSAPLIDNAAGSSMPPAPSNRKAPVLETAVLERALVPPVRTTHARRSRIVVYRRQIAPERQGTALWRPDARAGPLPGGGFYGPPNVNIGYINPR